MIGDLDWLGIIVGGVSDGDISANTKIAKALIRIGLAVVIIEPAGKKAVCIFNAAERKRADVAAQDEAREKGAPNWERVKHDCGIRHAITDEKMLTRAGIKRQLEAGANLAVSPGDSSRRVLVVDVDTESERKAFLADWSERSGDDRSDTPMTVASPGVMGATSGTETVWVHKDGGHFWFDIPDDVILPERPGKLTWCRCHGVQQPTGGCLSAWCAYYGSGYVLVPPSVRPEGPYRLTGGVEPAPLWLTDLICESRTPEREDGRTGALSAFSDDPIDVWAQRTSWAEILTGDFTPYAHDTCGCPTFTRVGGDATHKKSATGHEVGCAQYDTAAGHAPLHIWSDAVGGRNKTLSKLSYIAQRDHGGNIGAAMGALGINAMHNEDDDDLFELGSTDDYPKGEAPEQGADKNDDSEDDDSWACVDLTALLDGEYEPVKPDRMMRTDGKGLIYSGMLHSFHGESESGKSLVLLWEAALTMNEGEDVLWIDFDSDAAENVGRLLAFGVEKDVIREHFHYVRPETGPKGSKGWGLMFTRTYGLAVIDGVTDAVMLLTGEGTSKGDPNQAFTYFSRRLPKKLAKYTGAAVCMIDHVTKDTQSRGRFAIGAQAKMSQLSGAAYLVEITEVFGRGMRGEIKLSVGKDRPGGVRPNAGEGGKSQLQEVARVTVDDTGSHTVLTIRPHGTALDDPFEGLRERTTADTADMIRVSTALTDRPEGLGINQIKEVLKTDGNGMRHDRVKAALEALEADGYVSRKEIVKGKQTPYTLIKPFNDSI
jgi:hypothetical protein